MNATVRLLLAMLLAAWISLPVRGSEGGENAGGIAIWILPRATQFGSGNNLGTGNPRDFRAFNGVSQTIHLGMSDNMGAAVATITEDGTGVPTPLPTSGSQLTIPGSLLQAMLAHGATKATIVVTDSNQIGYYMQVTIVPAAGKVEVRVY